MIIGIPRELKKFEYRVAMTPEGSRQMSQKGHQVLIQSDAGSGSDYSNAAYQEAGCEIVETAREIFLRADMIIKVTEPIGREYPMIRENQIIMAFFHFVANQQLTRTMLRSKSIAIAFDTIEVSPGNFPVYMPMCAISGKMAIHTGGKYLEKQNGGNGAFLGNIPGGVAGTVGILGGSVAAIYAAREVAAMGGNVFILENQTSNLFQLSQQVPASVNILPYNDFNLLKVLKQIDLLIGAIQVPGQKTPHWINHEMLQVMKPRSVVVDLAIDHGGSLTSSRPTSHEEPSYVVENILHYCVPNMPAIVPKIATPVFADAVLPYALYVANEGIPTALRNNPALARGVNMFRGYVTHQGIAETFGLDYSPLEQRLGR
ncbi:MAG: alanine dehydrogenase [SAR324 cluster bacterium]|nr:alanine dehydrogenase [SAR324 cluster bacterium]